MSARAWRVLNALAASDPALAPTLDLALARRTIESFRPPNAQQAELRARFLAFVDAHPRDAHERSLQVGHLTASALVVDASFERALLTHHKKLGRWLQLGGHCDGDANLAGSALREAREESGIDDLRVLPEPIDLDVHTIPERPGEPQHEHWDVRFLALAPAGALEHASDESNRLGWFTLDEVRAIDTDASVRRLFERVLGARL